MAEQAARAAVAAPRPRGRTARWDEVAAGYLFLLPACLILGIFVVAPLFYAAYLSLLKYNLLRPQEIRFVGLANYVQAWHDPVFWIALRNIFVYAAGVVPTQMVIALFLGLLVGSGLRFQGFFRVVYFVPTVTSSVVVSYMFLYLYANTGLLNHILAFFHLPTREWMNNTSTALPAIMAMNVWSTVGQYMVIFLAGLQEVPQSFYEAAMIDGAGWWQRLRYITLPLLRPTTLFIGVMSVIGTLQVFDQMYLMTDGNGGPLNSTMTMVLYIWKWAFGGYFNMGYAAALSVLLFLIILVLTIIQKRWFGEEVQY